MKKTLLAAVGLASLGIAPALAADLPARTYAKAPAVVPPVYDWSGFYIGLNGGGASSRECYTINSVAGVAIPPILRKAVTTRPAAWPAARSAIAGRLPTGCSASKPRAIGLT